MLTSEAKPNPFQVNCNGWTTGDIQYVFNQFVTSCEIFVNQIISKYFTFSRLNAYLIQTNLISIRINTAGVVIGRLTRNPSGSVRFWSNIPGVVGSKLMLLVWTDETITEDSNHEIKLLNMILRM